MYTRFSQHVRSLDSVASNPAAGASRSLAAGVAAPRRRARRCSAACRAAPQLREAEAATDSAPSTSSTIDASSGSSGSSSSSSTRSSGGSSYSTSALGGAAAGASAAPRLGAPQAAALLATLGAAGGSTYQVLASQPQLPPLADATQALGLGAGALLGGAAAFAAAAKAALGDRFHLELHRCVCAGTLGAVTMGAFDEREQPFPCLWRRHSRIELLLLPRPAGAGCTSAWACRLGARPWSLTQWWCGRPATLGSATAR